MYNFCTMDDSQLVRFTFDLIDEDRSGYLSKAEVFDMVRLMAASRARIKTGRGDIAAPARIGRGPLSRTLDRAEPDRCSRRRRARRRSRPRSKSS